MVIEIYSFRFFEISIKLILILQISKNRKFEIMWQQYIISDKQILLGKPTIKGTRLSVELILELLALGWTEEQILESYPNLTQDALRAVFTYLKECMQHELYFPLPASV